MVPPSISHYRILRKLGEGGMGEVYLAQDSRLDRRVALKVLPEGFATDDERMRRFVQEAKAASALNHPNILTIHEIGEADGKHFIATEFIEGETLRHHIEHSRMKIREVLDATVQVASALAAAHQASIIHRDIKPENIMLRPDGYVKVLDFGLAKLTQKQRPTSDSAAATVAKKETDPGTVMGTVAYMSPEQARGKEVDARSDIFSLGVVLYEMIAGRVPFAGESSTDVLAAILDKEPLPLARFSDEVPQELQRIVTKCLRKERDGRYQTMKDALLDLKELRDELALAAKLERSVRPVNQSAESQQTLIAEGGITQEAGRPTESAAVAPTTSSAEYLVSEIKQHKRGVAVGLIVLLAMLGLGYWLLSLRGANVKQIESIAVMPFVNESSNAEVEYLSDGMTETLISSLSQLPNLSVKSRSTVFYYKGKETTPKKIGEALGVQAVLLGRVVQRGDDLKLSLELVNTQTQDVIWSESYNRKQSDLVALQSEIARHVSSKINAKLSGAEETKVTKTVTSDTEAYQAYLKGRYFWNKRTPESLRKAVELYKQAIEKDPSFALALTGLAETYVLFSFYGVAPPKESMPQAKAAIERALAIDDSLAEAHAARGKYLAFFEYDRTGSEREFRRAIELNPKYATARHWLGLDFLVLTKRFDEGIRELKLAGEIDPLSPVIGADTASALGYAGRFDEAIEQAKSTLVLEPGFSYAHSMIGYALDGKGQYAEAIKEFEKAIELSDDPYARAMLIRSLVRSGKRSEAERQMEALKSLSKKSYVPNFCFAIAYTALGDEETAIAMLEKDVEERSSYVVTSGIELALDELRDDPRFKDLLKRMNLPE